MPSARYYLIDTSYWIALWKMKGEILAVEKVEHLFSDPLAVPCINGIILAELLRGLTKNRGDEKRKWYIYKLKRLDITKETFAKAAELAQFLDRKGATISLPDCVIAANAIEHETTLITGDRHFLRFKDLKVVVVQ